MRDERGGDEILRDEKDSEGRRKKTRGDARAEKIKGGLKSGD